MGYLYALMSSLFFSMYALPKKKTKIEPHIYVLFMGISSFILSLLFFIVFGTNEILFDKKLLLSVAGGIIWFVASFLFFHSVDKIGVARASGFKSLQGPIGSLLMLIILSEFVSLNIYLLLLAVVFIFMSARVLVIKEDTNYKINLGNVVVAVLSAVFYALAGFIRKVITNEGFVYIQQVYTSIGLLVMSFIYSAIKEKKISCLKNKSFYPLLSGMFYYFASYFMLLSYKNIEGSIAFPIIQLNSLWSCIIGVFAFKEIDYRKYCIRLILGLIFALIGLYLLVICS